MANTLLLLAIVAFGATVAMAHGHKGGDHGKHGKHDKHGKHGKHHGPPPPEVLRFKMLHFVHSTFCYGLALPNMSLPNANGTGLTFDPAVLNRTRLTFDPAVLNRTRLAVQPMMLRKPMVGAGKAFRQLVADASDSDSSSSSSSSASDSSSSKSDSSKSDSSERDSDGQIFNTGRPLNETPKPNATVVAEEARLSRTVTKAAAAIVLSQAAGSNDAGCKALVKAEQEWIDYRKANNMPCKGNRKPHGPHGPKHGHAVVPPPPYGVGYPPMDAAVVPPPPYGVGYPPMDAAVMYPPPHMMNVPAPRAPLKPTNGAMNITRQTTTVVQNQRPMLLGKPAPKH